MPEGKTEYIGFWVEPELANKIQQAADKEERTRSDWCRLHLKRITESKIQAQPSQRVAA